MGVCKQRDHRDLVLGRENWKRREAGRQGLIMDFSMELTAVDIDGERKSWMKA